MNLNKYIDATEPDYDFIFPTSHDSYRQNGNYLPEYVREAMKKAGVVRTESGKFVKKSDINQ